MLVNHRDYRTRSLDASLSEHALLHARYRIILKERRNLVLDDRLFGAVMRPVQQERSCLFIQLVGELRIYDASGAAQLLRPGELTSLLRNNGLGIRQAGDQSTLVIEWEPGLLGTRLLETAGPMKLSPRTHARLQALALPLRNPLTAPAAAGAAARILSLLRAEGLPFDPLASGDLLEEVPVAHRSLAAAIDKLFASLSEGVAMSDLEETLGWSRHQVLRILSSYQEAYALQATGGWRALYHWWRLPIAAGLMSIPGARTEEVASLLGYASPRAFCNAFANAGFPSPGAIPQRLSELA